MYQYVLFKISMVKCVVLHQHLVISPYKTKKNSKQTYNYMYMYQQPRSNQNSSYHTIIETTAVLTCRETTTELE